MSNKTLNLFLKDSLNSLKKDGLYNEIQILNGSNESVINIDGKKFINLSSNNYLGFTTQKTIMEKSIEAIEKYGVGAGAVRTINGTLLIHDELEKEIANFKGTEDAIAFQSGFNCNIGVISSVMMKGDCIFSDELNHASIIDGCRLSGAKIVRYKHNDMKDLEEKILEVKNSFDFNKGMIITDGVFSMDGDVVNLPELVKVAEKYDLITYVDDSHGTGVMGNGAGTCKHFSLQDKIDFQMGTLSKAIGVVGGYVAGSKLLIDYLKVKARPFLFSTSLTPASAAAALEAIRILNFSIEPVQRLWENGNYFKRGLKNLGFNIGKSETPITPCIIGDENKTQAFSKKLFENGVYAKAIVFPTVSKGTGRIRNMPTAQHSKDILDEALSIYEKIGKELEVI